MLEAEKNVSVFLVLLSHVSFLLSSFHIPSHDDPRGDVFNTTLYDACHNQFNDLWLAQNCGRDITCRYDSLKLAASKLLTDRSIVAYSTLDLTLLLTVNIVAQTLGL